MRLVGLSRIGSKVSSYSHGGLHFGSLLTVGILAISACGSPTDQSAAAQSPAPAEAQTGPGESVPVTYTDTRFHYRVDAPGGRMTPNADGTASYIGPSERLEIAVVQGSQAANPGAIASRDLSSVAASAPGFQKLADPATVTMNGRKVIRFVYRWNAGISQVTGKAIDLTTVRYYVPKDGGTLAVIAYGIVSNQFDPQGADDLVLTFQWL